MRRHHHRFRRPAGPPSQHVPLLVDLDILEANAAELGFEEAGTLRLVKRGSGNFGEADLLFEVFGSWACR